MELETAPRGNSKAFGIICPFLRPNTMSTSPMASFPSPISVECDSDQRAKLKGRLAT